MGNARAVHALEDVVKSQKPNIMFLIETLSIKEKINKLVRKLGYENCWVVDSCGRSGGLAMCWDITV